MFCAWLATTLQVAVISTTVDDTNAKNPAAPSSNVAESPAAIAVPDPTSSVLVPTIYHTSSVGVALDTVTVTLIGIDSADVTVEHGDVDDAATSIESDMVSVDVVALAG